jgi:hypothetical protein
MANDLTDLIRLMFPPHLRPLVAFVVAVVIMRTALRSAFAFSPLLKERMGFPLNIIAMDVPQFGMPGLLMPEWMVTGGILFAGVFLMAVVIAGGIWWEHRAII